MKKSKTIVFLLSLFFLCMSVVEAKENPFVLDWKNDDKATAFQGVGIIDANLIYNDEYVNFRVDMNPYNEKISTVLRRYDHNGNVAKEKVLDYKIVKNVVTDGEYIYAVTFDIRSLYGGRSASVFSIDTAPYVSGGYNDTVGLSIVKFNKNFGIEEQFDFKYDDIDYLENDGDLMNMLMIQLFGRLLGYSTMTVDNNSIYFLQYGMGILSIDKDLKELSVFKIDYNPRSTKIKNYFEQVYDTSRLGEKLEEGIISLDKNENYYAYTSVDGIPDIATMMSMRKEYPTSMPVPSAMEVSRLVEEKPKSGHIGLTDAEGNKIWEEDLGEYTYAVNVELINDYVVAIVTGQFGSAIAVYDLEGKLVQVISNETAVYTHLVPTEVGFMVSKNEIDVSSCMAGEANLLLTDSYGSSSCAMYTTTEVYQLSFDISTNVTGEGEVNVNSESFAGEEQSVEVKPKFGWKVDKVVVTDKDGNEIEVKDGKFVMPASEVTIEVTFTKIIEEIIQNPNTAAVSIMGISLLAGGLGFIVNKNYKKLKFLK